MNNDSPTLEYQGLMQAFRSHKFTKNDIKSFVYKVFSMYERATCSNVHIDAEAFHDLVDEAVYVDFPDYQIRSREEFKTWHRWIHDKLVSDDHEIEKIRVEYLTNGKYLAQFFVRWRGEFKDGSYTDLKVEQQWLMREQDDKDHPIIERYLVGLANHIPAMTAGDVER